MIKSILVAIDGSGYATIARDLAVRLARAYQARLVGLYVLDVRLIEMPPYLNYSFEGIPLTPLPLNLLERFREKGDKVLEDFRQAVQMAGVPVEIQMGEAVPAEAIAELGDAHDLTVLGRRGEHARWGKDLLGSTAEAVVRRATSPVLLAPERATALADMLLLYDGSHPANHALKLAADVCTHLDGSLRVLTVGETDEAAVMQAEARDYLSAFTMPSRFRIRSGDVVMATMDELAEDPADLVAAGKKGHGLLHKLILGSTAEHLMREIGTPMLLAP